MPKTQPPVVTRKTVGLDFLERILQKNPSTSSEPLSHFNGFHQVIIINAKGIFDHVHEKDGLKATVILNLWKAHCSDRAVCALIAKPFLEGLFDAHTQGNDEADITKMFAQKIHFLSPEDGTPRILTPLGIWEFISPWLRWDDDQSKSNGILRLKFSQSPISLDPIACNTNILDFPVDPRLLPLFSPNF